MIHKKGEHSYSAQDIKQFFEGWALYTKVIENNYMSHREMQTALEQHIKEAAEKPLSILDLGCGDASMVAKVLSQKSVEHYCGIDLSDMALDLASKNFAKHDCKTQFIQGDFTEILATIKSTFDVIIAGYSIHHLMRDEKTALFRVIKSLLRPGGVFLMYDFITRENESRQACLQRFCQVTDKIMTNMSTDELDMIYEHVLNNDYPESEQFYRTLAMSIGFTHFELKFIDPTGLYGFCVFGVGA